MMPVLAYQCEGVRVGGTCTVCPSCMATTGDARRLHLNVEVMAIKAGGVLTCMECGVKILGPAPITINEPPGDPVTITLDRRDLLDVFLFLDAHADDAQTRAVAFPAVAPFYEAVRDRARELSDLINEGLSS